jgi:uncharacterized protein (DUF1330 family)
MCPAELTAEACTHPAWRKLFDIMKCNAEAAQQAFFAINRGAAQTEQAAYQGCMLLATPSFHPEVLLEGVAAFKRVFPGTSVIDALIFPCCGMGVYEICMVNELLRLGYAVQRVIFMDRALMQGNEYWRCDAPTWMHLHSFLSLSEYVRSTYGNHVVVGFNALTTHRSMFSDPDYEKFIHSCQSSEHVHDKCLLISAVPRTLKGVPDITSEWIDWHGCLIQGK